MQNQYEAKLSKKKDPQHSHKKKKKKKNQTHITNHGEIIKNAEKNPNLKQNK